MLAALVRIKFSNEFGDHFHEHLLFQVVLRSLWKHVVFAICRCPALCPNEKNTSHAWKHRSFRGKVHSCFSNHVSFVKACSLSSNLTNSLACLWSFRFMCIIYLDKLFAEKTCCWHIYVIISRSILIYIISLQSISYTITFATTLPYTISATLSNVGLTSIKSHAHVEPHSEELWWGTCWSGHFFPVSELAEFSLKKTKQEMKQKMWTENREQRFQVFELLSSPKFLQFFWHVIHNRSAIMNIQRENMVKLLP